MPFNADLVDVYGAPSYVFDAHSATVNAYFSHFYYRNAIVGFIVQGVGTQKKGGAVTDVYLLFPR